jgi:hypothetical protein
MASERQHALSPLGPAAQSGSALSSSHPSGKSIAFPESAIPPPPRTYPPATSPLASTTSPPPPTFSSARQSHLRPTFTLDDPSDDPNLTHDGSVAPAVTATHGSRRDVLAGEEQRQQQRSSRPASTRSAGAQPSARSADGGGARLRPRSNFSDRRPENYARPGNGGYDGPTEKRSKADAAKPAPAQGPLKRLLHQVMHNPVFPLDWVGPALSKRGNLKVLFRCTLSVRPQCCSCALETSADCRSPCLPQQAWIGMLFIIISETETMLGQASFFVLVIGASRVPLARGVDR